MAALCSSDNSTSTIADHLKLKKPRNPTPTPTTTTTEQIPSIMQSTRCKSAISSLLLSTFSNNNNNNNNNKSGSKKCRKGTSLLGFGCTAQPEVSVPGVIRSSANWDEIRDDNNNFNNKKDKKKTKAKTKKKKHQLQGGGGGGGVMMMDDSVVQDLWCGADSSTATASVDCLHPLPSRNKIDLYKPLLHNSQHVSYSSGQRVSTEHYGALDLDSAFDASHIGPDVLEARYYHHLRNRSPDGLAEILMFENGLLMRRRSGGLDRYRDWRLDVDSMTYEELLELGERIGHVNTGLGDDQIGRCLRKTKLSVVDELSSQSYAPEVEPKCSICQEEYESDDEMGKLECGHAYHLHCIKQWLSRKNVCPVCKTEASSR
ncbi:E3 ubiquitin-protein ligase MBR2-like [Silene latifolia]|uniref:E3 ubiquitin-protein ligase MBR2-like n=1 Tax=Silene latifolia TaxID=37657 RepID=UPI003D7876E6